MQGKGEFREFFWQWVQGHFLAVEKITGESVRQEGTPERRSKSSESTSSSGRRRGRKRKVA
jgi:hypothetical protein